LTKFEIIILNGIKTSKIKGNIKGKIVTASIIKNINNFTKSGLKNSFQFIIKYSIFGIINPFKNMC